VPGIINQPGPAGAKGPAIRSGVSTPSASLSGVDMTSSWSTGPIVYAEP
jgi:hypothetical protein